MSGDAQITPGPVRSAACLASAAPPPITKAATRASS